MEQMIVQLIKHITALLQTKRMHRQGAMFMAFILGEVLIFFFVVEMLKIIVK